MSGISLQCLTLLFGWIRIPVQAFWNLLSGRGGNGLLSRIWPLLLIIVCAAGAVIDIIVNARARQDAKREAAERARREKMEEEARILEASSAAGEEITRLVPREPAPVPEIPARSPYARPSAPVPDLVFDAPAAPRTAPSGDMYAAYRRPADTGFVFDEAVPPMERPVPNASAYIPPVREQAPETAFSRISRKARSLMGENPASISDFRSSVDMREALRDPVYPQQYRQGDS